MAREGKLDCLIYFAELARVDPSLRHPLAPIFVI